MDRELVENLRQQRYSLIDELFKSEPVAIPNPSGHIRPSP